MVYISKKFWVVVTLAAVSYIHGIAIALAGHQRSQGYRSGERSERRSLLGLEQETKTSPSKISGKPQGGKWASLIHGRTPI